METIYGVQADTASLREAHERQKRISQQRLQEQNSTLGSDHSSNPVAVAMPLKGPPKPSLIARSTSASALPSRTQQQHHSQLSEPQKQQQQQQQQQQPGPIRNQRSALEDDHWGPASSSFLSMLDKHPTSTTSHGSHLGIPSYQLPSTQPPLINSANQSPAFLAKRFYDSEPRMPWLALPGSAAGLGGSVPAGDNSPSLFMGRRRSDVGLGGGGTPTSTGSPTGGAFGNSDGHGQVSVLQPENNSPRSPHTPHHHHQHLLSQQDIVNLSHHGSPMPLNEALPHYLRTAHRKTSVDTLHQPNNTSPTSLPTSAMERSFSSPNAGGVVHTAPVSPFMVAMPPSLSAAADLAAVANASNRGHTPALRSTAGSSVNSLAGSGANTPALVPGAPSSYHHTSPSHLLFPFPGSHTPRPEIERGGSTGPLPASRSGWLDSHAHGYAVSGSTTPLGGPGAGVAATGTGLGHMGSRLHPSSGTTASNSKEVRA